MGTLQQTLRVAGWNLERAHRTAQEMLGDKAAARTLVKELFGSDAEIRKRAADVARRLTDRDLTLLEPYADQLAGLLEDLPLDESRTRWHLALVVPRLAHTPAQRACAARTMSLLATDKSNVVRCSAVEGLTLLALHNPSLREEAGEMIERFMREGTPAMKCRARHARRLLDKTLPVSTP